MFRKRYLMVVLLQFAFFYGFTQEKVVHLWDNPALKSVKAGKNRLKTSVLRDTLSLPFFDDFSGTSSSYPKSALWQDSFVYINDSRAVNPLSLGVASFDVLDQHGKMYKRASEKPFLADVLTSKPIYMKYPSGSGAYLTFYYQPQGLSDAPESTDSLLLDFYNPASKKWWNVWKVKGSGLHPFKAVSIPVNADSFLVAGFQFRFRNKASVLENDFDQGKMGDADNWNIDYVKLDVNRTATDTVMRDVAFVRPVGSLLYYYQSMPWKQFQVAFQTVMRKDIDVVYRNNDTIGHKPDRYFVIRELKGNNITSFYAGNENVNAQEVYHFTTNLEYPFATEKTDSVTFEVKGYLRTEPYDIKINDTTRFLQVFSNYFAYDDGSPEYGYGLSGQGTINGMVACKFHSYFPDSLSAVRIFFNSTENDLSRQFGFLLTVWSAASSGPGKIIYQSEQLFPADLGRYTTYKLDSALIVNGDFYVGWQQPGENFLNVGMDRNHPSTGNLFYNTGAWNKSSFDNSALMIRPVFGSRGTLSGTPQLPSGNRYKIYPNPTDGLLHIQKPGEQKGILFATVMNITGKIMMQKEVTDNISLENIPTGMYYLVLTDNGSTVFSGKIIVQH